MSLTFAWPSLLPLLVHCLHKAWWACQWCVKALLSESDATATSRCHYSRPCILWRIADRVSGAWQWCPPCCWPRALMLWWVWWPIRNRAANSRVHEPFQLGLWSLTRCCLRWPTAIADLWHNHRGAIWAGERLVVFHVMQSLFEASVCLTKCALLCVRQIRTRRAWNLGCCMRLGRTRWCCLYSAHW